ncbi:MAG: PEP-CTERM sorting domain-containing protein [Phycisphaerales bacterium]|jgi:hypothetical protein
MKNSIAIGALALAAVAGSARADLQVREFIQNSALSISGFGSTSNSGFVQANIPAGSRIERAYLYAASVWNNPVSSVTLAGKNLSLANATVLAPNSNPATTVRWDVTSIISSTFVGGLQNFSITENGNNDGQVLVVAYSNPSTQGFTSIIVDGELRTQGDSFRLNFANPYAGGNMLVSLASSFSRQPSYQYTRIDVTTNSTANRRLTTSAGGSDDGERANGGLITVGGIGDSPTNPDPFAYPDDFDLAERTDDEYYNLALGNSANANPFIMPGDTFVQFDTINPSNDDNVFGMFITSEFRIIPAPSSVAMLGLGGLLAARRRR